MSIGEGGLYSSHCYLEHGLISGGYNVAPLGSAQESAVLEAVLMKFSVVTLATPTAIPPQYKIDLKSSLPILFIIENSYVQNLNVTWI